MYNSSDQFYTSGRYYECNPDWHQEGSGYKAQLAGALIRQFQMAADTITEVGCGAGAVLLELSKQFPEAVLRGYDISPHAIRIASRNTSPRLNFFLADYNSSPEHKSDIILVLDVLEHIDDVYSFLRKLRGRGENFIFHIPLDMSCRTLLKPHTLLQQRTTVGHIHYFTEETALWMLADTGFEIKHFIYTKPEVDLIKPRSFRQWVKKLLRRISYGINRKLSVKLWGNYSMMIFAKPMTEKTDENPMAL